MLARTTFFKHLHNASKQYLYTHSKEAVSHGKDVTLCGIKGKVHAPTTPSKVYFVPDLVAKNWMQNKKHLKRAETTTKLDVLDRGSFKTCVDKRQEVARELSIRHTLHHLHVLIAAYQQSSIPTMDQVEPLGNKYLAYKQHCLEEGIIPKSFQKFAAQVLTEARKQGILCADTHMSEHDVCLLAQSIVVDGFRIPAAINVYDEILFRNEHGIATQLEVTEPVNLSRIEGYKGYNFHLQGSSGIFYSPGLQVIGDTPLESGMPIHPIIAHAMMAIGVGARQTLTDKVLVLNARNCLLKLEQGDEPTQQEFEAYSKWSQIYSSGQIEQSTFLMKYLLNPGDKVGIGTATSPGGMITNEVYPMGFKKDNLQCVQITDGITWPVFCSKRGEIVDLEITSSASKRDLSRTNNLSVVVTDFGRTELDFLNTHIHGHPDSLCSFSELMKEHEEHQTRVMPESHY